MLRLNRSNPCLRALLHRLVDDTRGGILALSVVLLVFVLSWLPSVMAPAALLLTLGLLFLLPVAPRGAEDDAPLARPLPA